MINEQIKVQRLLQNKFLDFKSKNPSFSVRAFAQKLGLSASATNEILKGQRRVSRDYAERIADRLMLDPTARAELLRDFPLRLKRRSNTEVPGEDLKALRLSAEQFELLGDWVHFAILSLIRAKGFRSEVLWMSERLGVSSDKVRKALFRLQHLKLIEIGADGVITRTPQRVQTSDDVTSLAVQRMHLSDMELAKVKLQNLPVEERDFSSLTFPGDPDSLRKAKEIIRNAQDQLAELMGEGKPSEVYRLCTYLFPLTETKKSKESL